jgi:iron(III) transport system permease protein
MTAGALAAPLTRLRQGGRAAPLTAVGVLGLLGACAIWPVARLITLADPGAAGPALAPVVRSLLVAALVAVLTVAAALPLAYEAARAGRWVRRLASAVALLPLAAPPFLAPLGLGLLLGRDGVLARALGLSGSIPGYSVIVAAQIILCLPWAFVPLAGALRAVEPAFEEAAEVLGAGPFATLWSVTLRLARPGLVTAALLVFIQSLGDLASPWLLGGGLGLAATEIYGLGVREPNLPAAATVGLLLLALTASAFTLGLAGAWRRWWTGAWIGVPAPAERAAPAAVRRPLAFAAGTVGCGVALVVGAVLAAALAEWTGGGGSVAGRPRPVALAEGAGALARSLGLAAGAGLAGTALVLLMAYLVVRGLPGRGGARALLVTGLLPLAVPGPVLGLGYLAAFGAPSDAAGAAARLVAGVMIGALPVGLLVGLRAVAALDPAAEDAARGLGLGRLAVALRVLLPGLGGAARLMFLWFFAHGVGTVAAVAFLVPDRGTVASVLGLAAAGEQPGVAAALAVLLAGAVAAAAGLLWPRGHRRYRRAG